MRTLYTTILLAFIYVIAQSLPSAFADNSAPVRLQTTVKIGPRDTPTVSQEATQAGITPEALVHLRNYDVVLLIDKSGSMSTPDCYSSSAGKGRRFFAKSVNFMPSLATFPLSMIGTSRWQWCQDQVSSLSRITSQIFPQGITVVLFSDGFWVYNHVLLNMVPNIFQNNYPEGNTFVAEPLQSQLAAYFQRRAFLHGQTRPLLIALITDGLPTDFPIFKKAIINATYQMSSPSEITITILQIGNSWVGTWQMEQLANKLTQEGAKYPIVSTKTFSDLLNTGLTKALIDAITNP